jgi:hypothetical protein
MVSPIQTFTTYLLAPSPLTADPEDSGRRLFIPSKTNLGKPRNGLAYRIADTALQGPDYGSMIWAPYVKWEDAPVTISADQAMAALGGGPDGRSAIEEAKQFLLDVLSDGRKAKKKSSGRQRRQDFIGGPFGEPRICLAWRRSARGALVRRADGSGVSQKSLRCPLQSLATLAILAVSRALRCLRCPT